MAKPFSIQSPEDIAKEYAGNKQRIAQAMQLGVVDPTAGVLAGMFIDRMRSAQMQEQAPQATVAQQVMGGAPATPPPPPSGGLGAAPPVAPPMAPMQPPMPAPGGAPMGMADGGLATLPVPDAMFDEPTNGGFDDGYAGGGLVAFAGGGPTFEEDFDATFRRPDPVPTPIPPAPSFYGYSIDPRQNMGIARELMGVPESKYSGMLEKDLLETLDPAAMEKRRKGRMWEALTDIGFRLAASRNPSLFGAIGEAGLGALPAAREAKQLDKSEQKFARKALADLEAGRNTQRAQIAAQALQMQQTAIQGYEAETGRKFQATEKQKDRDLDLRIAGIRAASSGGGGGGGGGGGAAGAAGKPLSPAQAGAAMDNSRRNAEAAYKRAKEAENKGDIAEAERALKEYGAARDAYNRFASMRGETGMAQADLSVRAFPKLNQYVTKNKQFPSGRRSAELERKGAYRGAPAGGGAAKPKSFPGTDAEWRAMTAAEQKLFM